MSDDNNPLAIPHQPGNNQAIFADVDMSKFNLYDKYFKLLVSIVMHNELYRLDTVPIWLKVPTPDTPYYLEIMKENDGVGYLNFNMIL